MFLLLRVFEAIICLNTSAASTHVSQPCGLFAVTVAVLLSFSKRAISPNPIMLGSEESSFSIITFSESLGSKGFDPGW